MSCIISPRLASGELWGFLPSSRESFPLLRESKPHVASHVGVSVLFSSIAVKTFSNQWKFLA